MNGQWKPGDVLTNGSGRRWFVVEAKGRLSTVGADGFQNPVFGPGYNGRPLVVIDPEDMAAVERLQDCYIAAENKGLSGLSMQAALREFANPTPPKPDEPQGLGAVVVDANDVLWIRVDGEYSNGPWFVPGGASCRVYDDVDVVKVLSSGYEQGVGEPLADWERDFLEVES